MTGRRTSGLFNLREMGNNLVDQTNMQVNNGSQLNKLHSWRTTLWKPVKI